MDAFSSLVATARRLQRPGGCAWDRAQTLQSLLPYLVEETWEAFEAIRHNRRGHLREELGDVLYTVLFLSLIAERRGLFSLTSLLQATNRKMIRRHPHVFGDRRANTPGEAYGQWQAAKRREQAPPSRSKQLRPLLVSCWEWLHRDPTAAAQLQRLVRRRAVLTKGPGRPVPRQRQRQTDR